MKIRKSLDKYLDLARRMSAETGTLRIFVPKMPGIDEDMRNWSFFMLLIHYRQAGYVVRKIEKTDHAL